MFYSPRAVSLAMKKQGNINNVCLHIILLRLFSRVDPSDVDECEGSSPFFSCCTLDAIIAFYNMTASKKFDFASPPCEANSNAHQLCLQQGAKERHVVARNHRLKLVNWHAKVLHSAKNDLATASHWLLLPIRKSQFIFLNILSRNVCGILECLSLSMNQGRTERC